MAGVSQGNFSAGPVGLKLVAWAMVDNTGALIKGQGIASASRTAAGQFSVTYTAARATNRAIPVITQQSGSFPYSNQMPHDAVATCTTAGATVYFYQSSPVPGFYDPLMWHIAVYE